MKQQIKQYKTTKNTNNNRNNNNNKHNNHNYHHSHHNHHNNRNHHSHHNNRHNHNNQNNHNHKKTPHIWLLCLYGMGVICHYEMGFWIPIPWRAQKLEKKIGQEKKMGSGILLKKCRGFWCTYVGTIIL